MSENKVYYNPGDEVTLRQNVTNKPPVMIIYTIDKVSNKDSAPGLLGVTCRWFNTKLELQSARFSTKDLVHV